MKKKLAICFAAVAMVVGVNFAAPQAKTFTGSIMDSACAKSGAHNPAMGTSKECTLACVKSGSTFVLYDATTKTAYNLDDQKKPEAFAGQNVKVTGTLDAATKTIHVTSIAAS
jgi:hypothetical protein